MSKTEDYRRNADECERMGREGRKRVEQFHTLEKFVAGVKGAVDDAVAGLPHAQ